MVTDTWIDRTDWPPGPWGDEPDREEWRDETTGYPCLALRARWGSWCGYVGVPPGHPLHGVPAGDVELLAHGGVNFSDRCMEDDRPQHERVCHVPAPGESDDVWWFGFDCNHLSDFAPGDPLVAGPYKLQWPAEGGVYRDLDYVRVEITLLAGQLGDLRDSGNTS